MTEDRRCSIEDLRWNSGDRRCRFVEYDVGVIQYGVGVMKTDRRWRNGERRWSFVGLDVAVTVNDVGVSEIRRGGLLVEVLSSRDEWRLCCVVERGTDVGAGSSGLFCEC